MYKNLVETNDNFELKRLKRIKRLRESIYEMEALIFFLFSMREAPEMFNLSDTHIHLNKNCTIESLLSLLFTQRILSPVGVGGKITTIHNIYMFYMNISRSR